MPRAPDGTAYEMVGEGPVVVLIHGMGLAKDMWNDLLGNFPDNSVLYYDLFGHGESPPATDHLSLQLFADQLAGLLDHVGESRAHLVGFSIGGMINRRFALDYPDRVASLAILNSPHERGETAQAAVERRASSARDQGAFATFDEALARWFTPAYLANGDGPARVRRWREQVDDESYAQTSWVLAHGVRELIEPDPPIGAPTLVMTSQDDVGSTPDMSRAIAAEIEGAECVIVPDLKHLGLLESPDAFGEPILSFLNRLQS